MTPQSNETMAPPVMGEADVTPMANMRAIQEANNAQLRTLAIGEGLGKRAIGEFFTLAAEQIGRNEREYDSTRSLYLWRFEVIQAEEDARGTPEADQTKTPTGNSLASQLTKANYITSLGLCERSRPGVIAVLRKAAPVLACQWSYKGLCVMARAIGEALVKDADATDEDLYDAAMVALDNMPVKGPKTLDSEIEKLLKTIEKLATKDFEPQVVAANKAKGYDMVKVATNALVELQNMNRRLGGADKPLAK